MQRLRDKIHIRVSLLNEGFQGLDMELRELRDRRLDGEDFSESDHREDSISVENDIHSQQEETEEEKMNRIIAEN